MSARAPLASARALNQTLHATFDESAVFRIDHYLGKETVQNMLALRFANYLFEPLWNRNYIDQVQITASEEVGVGSRAGYYDQTGALRDLIQNHLLQLLMILTMEPPVRTDSESMRDEKVQVLRGIQDLDPKNVVRGQFKGYRDEKGVAPNSQIETFAAIKLEIDSWRCFVIFCRRARISSSESGSGTRSGTRCCTGSNGSRAAPGAR